MLMLTNFNVNWRKTKNIKACLALVLFVGQVSASDFCANDPVHVASAKSYFNTRGKNRDNPTQTPVGESWLNRHFKQPRTGRVKYLNSPGVYRVKLDKLPGCGFSGVVLVAANDLKTRIQTIDEIRDEEAQAAKMRKGKNAWSDVISKTRIQTIDEIRDEEAQAAKMRKGKNAWSEVKKQRIMEPKIEVHQTNVAKGWNAQQGLRGFVPSQKDKDTALAQAMAARSGAPCMFQQKHHGGMRKATGVRQPTWVVRSPPRNC